MVRYAESGVGGGVGGVESDADHWRWKSWLNNSADLISCRTRQPIKTILICENWTVHPSQPLQTPSPAGITDLEYMDELVLKPYQQDWISQSSRAADWIRVYFDIIKFNFCRSQFSIGCIKQTLHLSIKLQNRSLNVTRFCRLWYLLHIVIVFIRPSIKQR